MSDNANESGRCRRFAWLAAVAVAAAGASHAQPELKRISPDGAAHPGEPYAITLEVSWAGEPDRWAVLPAEVAEFSWGSAKVEKAEAYVRENGINVVSQTVHLTPARTGEFETPEILIGYRNPEDLTPPEAFAPATNPTGPGDDPTLRATLGPSLRADPFILHVKPDRTLAWVFGGLGALLLLCLMLVGRSARKRRPPAGHLFFSPSPASSEYTTLEEARRHRLDGRPYEYYLALTRAVSVCPGEDALTSRLRERTQAVGYQGVVPTEAQMSEDYSDVERALARHPQKEARSA